MRIAYVSADPGVPVFGRQGASAHAQSMLRALRALGHVVELFTPRLGGEPARGLADLPVHPLPIARRSRRRPPAWTALEVNHHLRTALEAAGPFDLVYERYSLWSYAAMDWASRAGVRSVLEVNGFLADASPRLPGAPDRHTAERVARRAVAAAGTVVAVSHGTATELAEFGAPAGRLHLVPNAVDPARFPEGLAPAWSAPPGSFTVGYLGALRESHGVAALIQAVAILHRFHADCHLLLVGDGPERERLEDLTATHGLEDQVHFAGAVPPDEVPAWLAGMDVAVAPHHGAADAPIAPLTAAECMAAGLPLIASAVGELRQLVQHEITGFKVPPGDAMALASALARLRQDYALRRRLGSNGRAAVLRGPNWADTARRIVSLAAPGPRPSVHVPEPSGWSPC